MKCNSKVQASNPSASWITHGQPTKKQTKPRRRSKPKEQNEKQQRLEKQRCRDKAFRERLEEFCREATPFKEYMHTFSKRAEQQRLEKEEKERLKKEAKVAERWSSSESEESQSDITSEINDKRVSFHDKVEIRHVERVTSAEHLDIWYTKADVVQFREKTSVI